MGCSPSRTIKQSIEIQADGSGVIVSRVKMAPTMRQKVAPGHIQMMLQYNGVPKPDRLPCTIDITTSIKGSGLMGSTMEISTTWTNRETGQTGTCNPQGYNQMMMMQNGQMGYGNNMTYGNSNMTYGNNMSYGNPDMGFGSSSMGHGDPQGDSHGFGTQNF